MDLRFVESGDPVNSPKPRIDIPVARAGALMIVVKGTTDTGETLDPSDIGTIRLKRNNRQIHGEDFEFYHDYSNLKGGFPTATTPTAGASRLVAFIPMSITGFPNSMEIRSKEEVDLEIDFDSSTLSTRFGSNGATWEVYVLGQPSIPERYMLEVREQNVQASGGGRQSQQFDARNVGAIYLRDPDTVITTVAINVDGEVVVDTVDDAALLDVTNLVNGIESSGFTLTELFAPSGISLNEAVNENVEYDLDFSGAGTAEFTTFSVKFKDSPIRASERAVRRYLATRTNSNADTPAGAVRAGN